MRYALAFVTISALAMFCAPAGAQMAVVVTSCGNPPTTYTVGGQFPTTQDQNGGECTSGGGAANSTEGSTTITATNTFQQIFAANTSRKGCSILNNAIHQQWVYFQGSGMTTPTGGNFATIQAASYPLNPATGVNTRGDSIICSTGTNQLTDTIWIAGTINDTFVAHQQ